MHNPIIINHLLILQNEKIVLSFNRICVLLLGLVGNFVFMAYRASLTTELSTRRERMPFRDLHGLSESGFE